LREEKSAGVEAFLVGHPEISREYLGKLAGLEVEKVNMARRTLQKLDNDLDMWDEMRTASFLQKVATMDPCVLPAYEILKMATVNAARAIGHAGELGVIKEGALADFILIDAVKPHLMPVYNMVANLIYCGKAADVDTVVVNGEIVVEGRRIEGVDLSNLCFQVQHTAEDIARRTAAAKK
jgi:5-methylthioadenosine/S-adenosylhomocysteine deaminase